MAERKNLEFINNVKIINAPMKKQRFIVDGMIYLDITVTGTAVAVKTCTENAVPAVPENVAIVDDNLIEVRYSKLRIEKMLPPLKLLRLPK